MRTGSLSIALFVLVGSLLFIQQAHLLGESHNPDDVGPGYLPTGIGVVLVALSLILIVRQLRAPREPEFRHGYTPGGGIFMAACLLYVAATPLLGYFAATFLFTAGGVLVLEGRAGRWLAPVTAAGFVLFVYAVFWELLSVPLP